MPIYHCKHTHTHAYIHTYLYILSRKKNFYQLEEKKRKYYDYYGSIPNI